MASNPRSKAIIPPGKPSRSTIATKSNVKSDKRESSTSSPGKATITLELVMLDDNPLKGSAEGQSLGAATGGRAPFPDRIGRRFAEDENLGDVADVVSVVYDVESKERVALYPTSERSEALSNDITVGELPVSTLHSMISVEVEI